MPSQSWKLRGKRAVFDTPVAAGSLRMDTPNHGVQVERVESTPLDGVTLLRPLLPGPIPGDEIQCGLRASEPFVICPETASRPVMVDARWSVNCGAECDGRLAIDLRLQAITSQLSADPRVPIETSLRTDEIFLRGEEPSDTWSPAGAEADPQIGAVLLRLAGADLSYLEMSHPEAKTETHVVLAGNDEAARVRHLLFPGSLEKGVLVQAFTRGVFLPRQNDLATAESHYASFVALTPPLAS